MKGKILVCALSTTLCLMGEGAVSAPVTNVVCEGADWAPFENLHEIVPGSALDFSQTGIADAPAGKYGWVKSVNGHAEFERRPGKPARFYGVNLCNTANYLSDEQIEKLTDRLVRLGYNSIRIHHYDEAWSKDTDGARDKLDKLIAACVRKGIYLTTDLFVSRRCTWRELGVDKDGMATKIKLRMMSSDAAYENWKKFARDFLTHRNPYTGRTLAEEPAMPFLVLLNESSPHGGRNWNAACAIPEFRALWPVWLADVRARHPGAYPKAADEIPEHPSAWWNASADEYMIASFWAWVNERFCTKARAFLRNELKVRALVSTENNGPTPPVILRARATAGDYVDTHWYTEHASPASKTQCKEMGLKAHSVFHNMNVLCSNRYPYRSAAFQRVWGRPFTISESNMGGPNTYRAMAGLVTGAYAAIQDWSAVWTFALAHQDVKLFDGCKSPPGRFDLALDPILQATDRLPALLFLRGDQVTPEAAYANVFTPAALDPVEDKLVTTKPKWTSSDLAWRARLGVAFDESLPTGVKAVLAYPAEKPEVMPPSVGVTVNEKSGAITVAGPLTAGGFSGTNTTFTAGCLTAKVAGHHALVAVTSLDGTPIADSPRLLLWHLTDLHGNGFAWGGRVRVPDPCGTKTGILSWGKGDGKLFAHVGSADVTLALSRSENYEVWALDAVGNRKERIDTCLVDGKLAFTAAIRDGSPARFYYEIVRTRAAANPKEPAAVSPDEVVPVVR